jgi:hypothetical protein
MLAFDGHEQVVDRAAKSGARIDLGVGSAIALGLRGVAVGVRPQRRERGIEVVAVAR